MTISASAGVAPAAASRSVRPSFFLCMTLVMAVFVFGGFGMTYFWPLATGTFPPAPPVVHLHGIVFSSWIVLLVAQAALVNVRNVAMHRSLGMFGIALATAVMFMGALITLLGGAGLPAGVDPGANYYHGMYLGILAVTGFGTLFTLAIRTVRRPEIHRRMILFATLLILPPGVHRMYMVPFGLAEFPVTAMYLTLDVLALAILVHEWRTNGRIGVYSMIGAGWLLLQQLLHFPVIESMWFADFVRELMSMVRYR
ncbi:MAG: hypothetical protein ACO1PZ_04790 [Gammaproteobacteria bacterium]